MKRIDESMGRQMKCMRRLSVGVFLLISIYVLTACGGAGNSFMEEFELPVLGSASEDEQELEMPPGLVRPKASDKYVIPGSKASMQEVARSSYVLPERLDLRIVREGNTVWLTVGVEPVKLWPHLSAFLESYGFKITRENPAYGMLETNWLERELKDSEVSGMRIRDKFRVRLERETNATTNIYFANRKFFYQGGVWKASASDVETETDLLYDLGDYLRRLQEGGSALPELESVEIPLEVLNIKGVPALKIGHRYSQAWRALAVALDRTGIDVRDADRSRGVFLIAYDETGSASLAGDDDRIGKYSLLQLHVLAKQDGTIVTLHPNRADGQPLSYALAYNVLKRIVWAYT